MKKLTKVENLSKAYQAIQQVRRLKLHGEAAKNLEAIKKSIEVEIVKTAEFQYPEINKEVCGSPTEFCYMMLAREFILNIRTTKNISAILTSIEAEIKRVYGSDHLGITGYKTKIEEFNTRTNFKG